MVHAKAQSAINFSDLFYWVFVPLVQKALDEFKDHWNNHKIRYQPEKNMPSDHVPLDALEHPAIYEATTCLVKVPEDGQREVRDYLSEQVGPREQHLSWYDDEFAVVAGLAYDSIGSPAITLDAAWEVFDTMSQELANVL